MPRPSHRALILCGYEQLDRQHTKEAAEFDCGRNWIISKAATVNDLRDEVSNAVSAFRIASIFGHNANITLWISACRRPEPPHDQMLIQIEDDYAVRTLRNMDVIYVYIDVIYMDTYIDDRFSEGNPEETQDALCADGKGITQYLCLEDKQSDDEESPKDLRRDTVFTPVRPCPLQRPIKKAGSNEYRVYQENWKRPVYDPERYRVSGRGWIRKRDRTDGTNYRAGAKVRQREQQRKTGSQASQGHPPRR